MNRIDDILPVAGGHMKFGGLIAYAGRILAHVHLHPKPRRFRWPWQRKRKTHSIYYETVFNANTHRNEWYRVQFPWPADPDEREIVRSESLIFWLEHHYQSLRGGLG